MVTGDTHVRVAMDAQPSIPDSLSNIGDNIAANTAAAKLSNSKSGDDAAGLAVARLAVPSAPSGLTIREVPSFTLTDRQLHFTNEV